jgi:energy-coupling factor transporter ATP-binding protein EcfA2
MTKINLDVDGKRVLIVGQSGSGKSTVALDIIRYNKHVPAWTVVSPSESRNHTFGPHVHPGAIHEDLNIPALDNFRQRQEKRCKDWQIPGTKPTQYFRSPAAALVLDDCNISAKLFKEDFFRWAYFNSRHDKVLLIQITQCKKIKLFINFII